MAPVSEPGPEPQADAAAGNWIGPSLDAWRVHHGGDAPARVRGLLLKGLASIYHSGQTPEQMGARFAIWLAVRDPAKHNYVEDFTSRYGEFDPVPCDDSYHFMRLQDTYGPPTPHRSTSA